MNKAEGRKEWKLEYKMISTFVLIICISLINNFMSFIPAVLSLLVLFFITKVPLIQILKKILIPFIFIAFTVAFFPFIKGKDVLFSLGFVNIYSSGLNYSFLVFLKSMFILLIINIVLHKSELVSVINILRSLKINNIFLDILVFSYRWIMIFSDYLGKMLCSSKLRGAALSRGKRSKNILRKTHNFGNISGALISRSIDKSELVHSSMLLRAYCVNQNKKVRIQQEWAKASFCDVFYSFVIFFLGTLIVILDKVL